MTYFVRRIVIATAAAAALLLAVPSLPLSTQRPVITPKPVPSPNTPDGNVPAGLKGTPVAGPDQKGLDLQNQAEVRSDIEKLYALVFELREEMKLTDSTNTLSVNVVKKAQTIEKLAKEIKDRAKR